MKSHMNDWITWIAIWALAMFITFIYTLDDGPMIDYNNYQGTHVDGQEPLNDKHRR